MEKPESNQKQGPGYETHDLSVRVIVVAALISLLFLVVAVYVIDEIFQISKEKLIQDVVLKPVSVPLRELRSHEDEVLNTYKIIDTDDGIYQIPIEKAMEILANRAYQQGETQNKPVGNSKAP
jgi:hypothetical protein